MKSRIILLNKQEKEIKKELENRCTIPGVGILTAVIVFELKTKWHK